MRKKILIPVFILALMLVSIPVLIMNKYYIFAEVIGILLTISVLLSILLWRGQSQKEAPKNGRIKFAKKHKNWMEKVLPFYKMLRKEDKKIFEDRIGLFIANNRIEIVGEEDLDLKKAIYVASSAVIGFWGLPYYDYGRMYKVKVFPNSEKEVKHGEYEGQIMTFDLEKLQQSLQQFQDKDARLPEYDYLRYDKRMDKNSTREMEELHRETWKPVLQEDLESGIKNRQNSLFYAEIMRFYEEHPKTLEKRNPQLYDVIKTYRK